jgi:hypothetical protein
VEKLEDMANVFLDKMRGPQEKIIAHLYDILNDQNLLDLTEDITRGPDSSGVKNVDVNGSGLSEIHLHPPNSSWIST